MALVYAPEREAPPVKYDAEERLPVQNKAETERQAQDLSLGWVRAYTLGMYANLSRTGTHPPFVAANLNSWVDQLNPLIILITLDLSFTSKIGWKYAVT